MSSSSLERAHLIKSSRHLTEFAVSLDPVHLYDELEHPSPSRLPGAVANHLRHAAPANNVTLHEEDLVPLRFGVDNVQSVIQFTPGLVELGAEKLGEVIDHPTTVLSIARLALHSHDYVMDRLTPRPKTPTALRLSADRSHLLANDAPHSVKKVGCPFAEAARGATRDTVEHETADYRLFTKFVRWSSSLAIRSYYDFDNRLGR